MSAGEKDVIYIDVDEEITSVIDKVRSAEHRIVALVLPKRATVFQSIVNMKLLKRTGDNAKKHIVLITSEAGLLPLAGSVGVYVAKNLQSKPVVPPAPESHDELPEAIDDEPLMSDADDPLDKTKSVGELAGGTAAASLVRPLNEDESIEIDNTDSPPKADTPPTAKKKKDKKLAIPDFNKFRLLLIAAGAGLVLLIIGLYFALSVMPRATIAIKTDSSAINNSLDITLNTAAKELDVKAGVIPAQVQQVQKTLSQQVEATGQLDKGTKATGKVTIKNCGADEIKVPAGSAVSVDNLTFITQQTLDLDDGKFGGICKPSGDHIGTVDVVAQQAGTQYNLEARSDYKVAGQASTVTANGTAMTGGTTSIVKIVNQSDIDGAKQKISAQDTTAVKAELQKGLTDKGLYAIESSLDSPNPEVTASAKPGDEVSSVTVTEKVNYTMLGIQEADLKKVVADAVNEKIDTKKQSILDYGLDKAVIARQNQTASSTLIAIQITSVVGSDIDEDAIKKQVAGKKANNAKEIIDDYPGVTDVQVKYSPFWVSSIPKKIGKITVKVEEPKVSNGKPN